MSTLGLIGSGGIGSTLARHALAAGHEVVLSNSRGPQTLAGLAAELGSGASAGTTADAAAADLVVVTIPLGRLGDLDASLLDGATVIDTMNYYPGRDPHVPELDAGTVTTSRLVQRHLVGASVVKAFNNIYVAHLAALPRRSGAPDRTALPVAADDPAARARVSAFVDGLGFDALDAGTLDESWRFERDQPAYCLPYAADPEAFAAGGVGDRPQEARPASASAVRDALARAARRAD